MNTLPRLTSTYPASKTNPTPNTLFPAIHKRQQFALLREICMISMALPLLKKYFQDFPGGLVVKNLPANAGDTGFIPGPGDPTCHGATRPMCCKY